MFSFLFRFKNKLRYFEAGTSEQLAGSCKGLHNDVELIVKFVLILSLFMKKFNQSLDNILNYINNIFNSLI